MRLPPCFPECIALILVCSLAKEKENFCHFNGTLISELFHKKKVYPSKSAVVYIELTFSPTKHEWERMKRFDFSRLVMTSDGDRKSLLIVYQLLIFFSYAFFYLVTEKAALKTKQNKKY